MKFFNILTALLLTAIINLNTYAQNVNLSSELSLSDNMNSPVVPKKASEPIKLHMQNIKDKLSPHYQDVDVIRNGEALMVTIPCSDIFQPNSTEVKESGKKYLRPFLSLVKLPTMYKLLVAVYSDNTGEADYRDHLTEERAKAIDEFLCEESGTNGTGIIPYGMGSDDPISQNDTMANRAKNRRIEITIVPEWQMISTARSGKLK